MVGELCLGCGIKSYRELHGFYLGLWKRELSQSEGGGLWLGWALFRGPRGGVGAPLGYGVRCGVVGFI